MLLRLPHHSVVSPSILLDAIISPSLLLLARLILLLADSAAGLSDFAACRFCCF